MSIDEPAPGSGSRGELPAGSRRAPQMVHVRERTYLSLVPWRNFRRALFLVLALMGVVALKKSGAVFFHSIFDSVAPPTPAHHAPETTVHLQLGPPAR